MIYKISSYQEIVSCILQGIHVFVTPKQYKMLFETVEVEGLNDLFEKFVHQNLKR